MNQEIKERWVRALRSGEYKQGNEYLHSGDAYCCLGVLCELAVDAGVTKPVTNHGLTVSYYGVDENESAVHLPPEVMKWAGLSYNTGDAVTINKYRRVLAGHNDAGISFEEIADAIEAQL